jgi:phospholipid transport system substrate-binding protein
MAAMPLERPMAAMPLERPMAAIVEMKMRRMVVAVTALTALVLAGAAVAAPTPPDEIVKKTTAELQAEIGKREKEFRAKPEKLYAYVEQVIVPRFDTRYIAQLILARHWRAANDDQRARFEVAFKKMLVHSYANALLDHYDSVKAEWQPLRMAPDATDVTVQSRLLRDGKPPLPIGFAMRLKGDEWKVYDIVVENLSLVTSFRSQINSEVKRIGLDALIQKLETGQKLEPEAKSG